MPQTSSFARASELAAAMFAASATFLADGGSSAKVHEGDIAFEDQTTYPRPLIMLQTKVVRANKDAEGFKNFYRDEGVILVTMIRNTPAALISNPNAAARDHYEFFGKVRDEFNAKSGDSSSGDALDAEAEILDCGKPMAEDLALLGECFICIARILWGPQHGRQR